MEEYIKCEGQYLARYSDSPGYCVEGDCPCPCETGGECIIEGDE